MFTKSAVRIWRFRRTVSSVVRRQGRLGIKKASGFRKRRLKAFRTSESGLLVLRALQVAIHPAELIRRKRLGTHFSRSSHQLEIDRDTGFRRFVVSDIAGGRDLVALCQTLGSAAPNDARGGTLRDLLGDKAIENHPALVDFALSDAVLGAATHYLGQLPALRRVGLLLSSPAEDRKGSLLLHKDPEDLSQVKIFVNVADIDDRNGPFTFLPANMSKQIIDDLRRKDGRLSRIRRYTDMEALDYCHTTDFVKTVGSAGSALLIDTSRCLHFGSRVAPGCIRLVYYAQFCLFHQPFLSSSNRFDRSRFKNDPVRWNVLTPARRGPQKSFQDAPVHT